MADWTIVRRMMAPALLVVAVTRPAAAQELTAYATASLDGYDTNIGLIGASARPAGLGLRPVVALQVYRLQYDAGGTEGEVTVLSVGPSAGLSYRMPGGAVEGRVGYNFQSEDDEDVPFQEGEGGGGGGVTTSVQAISWASRPELQGIASYNWGSEYLWSTAQALVPIRELNPGGIAVGAEAVWQGNVGAEDADYQSWQAGPVLRWSTGRESSVTLGAGYKNGSTREGTWYARIGLVKYGINLGLL